eukprot:EG_transcript_15537
MASLLSRVFSSFRGPSAEAAEPAEQPSAAEVTPAASSATPDAPAPAAETAAAPEEGPREPLPSVEEVQRRILEDSGRASPHGSTVIDRYAAPGFTEAVTYSPTVYSVTEPGSDPVRVTEVRIGQFSQASPGQVGGITVSPSRIADGHFVSTLAEQRVLRSYTRGPITPAGTTVVRSPGSTSGYRRIGDQYVYDDGASPTAERTVYSSQISHREVHAIDHVTFDVASPGASPSLSSDGTSPSLRLQPVVLRPSTKVVGSYVPLQPVPLPAEDVHTTFSSKYVPLETQDRLVIPTEPVVIRHTSYENYERYCASKAMEKAF